MSKIYRTAFALATIGSDGSQLSNMIIAQGAMGRKHAYPELYNLEAKTTPATSRAERGKFVDFAVRCVTLIGQYQKEKAVWNDDPGTGMNLRGVCP